jgi:DNA-binding response OmpR family regulator
MKDLEATTEGLVLIVDDSADALQLLELMLKTERFAVVLADGGIAAVEAARTHPIEAILLDVMMPDMNGLEVCAELKRSPATASIPVILVTARDDMETRAKGMEVGVADYMTKPLNRAELIRRLKIQIAARRHYLELEAACQRLEPARR